MTSAFSWQNFISLCPASFCTPRPNLPVTPSVSEDFYNFNLKIISILSKCPDDCGDKHILDF